MGSFCCGRSAQLGLVAARVDHVDVQATDYDESVRFYEAILSPLGIPKLTESEEFRCFTNLNIRRDPLVCDTSICVSLHGARKTSTP
jgi:hypothetical protein